MDANFIKKHPHIETGLLPTKSCMRMMDVSILSDSSNYVGMLVDVVGCPHWRLIDFYGFPVE
ncbi:hypothetical protein Godav_020145 [Gossypium davidsonii]|uniref:Uncharacterized protein n=1 Tax=Gossypium davidsonii TaxID=34287 RepID=A0A7J8R3H2_GOSDV|nr:hypothetical protein [Gossypium davidsonii]